MEIDALVLWWGCGNRPLIIAGPCSAGSQDQVMEQLRRSGGCAPTSESGEDE